MWSREKFKADDNFVVGEGLRSEQAINSQPDSEKCVEMSKLAQAFTCVPVTFVHIVFQ